MKNVTKGISYVFSFILMVCIIAIISCNVVKTKILNEEYIFDALDKIDYYSKVNDEIESGFENYFYQSGLEHYVIENLYDKEKIKSDTKQIINAIYNNSDFNVEVESIKEKIRSNIDDMLEKQNKRIDSSEQETVNTFVNVIADVYEGEVTVYKSGIKTVANVVQKMENIINKVTKIIIAVTIILAILIIVLNIKTIFDMIKYFGISLFSSGIICILVNVVIKSSISVNKLYALSRALSEVMKYVVNDVLGNIQTVGIILTITGLILIFINAFSFAEDKKDKREIKHSKH